MEAPSDTGAGNRRTVTAVASSWIRYGLALGAVGALVQLAGGITQLVAGRGGAFVWFELLVGAGLLTYFFWMARLLWRGLVLQIDNGILAWRPMLAKRFERIPLTDISAVRVQDPTDVRLVLHSGEERSIHLSLLARQDRSRLVSAIRELAVPA